MKNIDDIIKYTSTLKLLYIEDNQDARESTLMIFEEFFYSIVVAVDGEDGYNKFLENDDIDLIITDINMPKLNGLDMTAKIRSNNRVIPILVLSAYNESGFFMESIKLGVEGYLLKPIDMEQFIGVLHKITNELSLQEKAKKSENILHQYKEITDKSSIISVIDKDYIITYVNDAFCNLSKYTKEELIGKEYHSMLNYKQPKDISDNIWDTISTKKEIWQGTIKFVSRNRDAYYLKTTIKPILDENNEIIEYIALRDNVSSIMNPKKQLDDEIKNSNDPLIVYIKLEEFDTIEDLYDNSTVEVIQDMVKSYLENYLPETCKFDNIYQLGNGEYVLTNEKEECLKNKNEFINNLKLFQKNIKYKTIELGDIKYEISILISLAYDEDKVVESAKLGIKELLNTKEDFIISNNFALKEQEKAKKNIKVISMVRKALNDFKIISYFQPIINNKTKEIEKYESLVRLVDEDGNVLSPFYFLDTAKKGKYYSSITSRVLDNSFLALTSTDKDISINLSAIDIELKSTRDKIFELLALNKEQASRIVIELLEDESVKDFNTIKTFISDIKQLGVKIAIDDFGAGYSNFERLLDYQPDILKIDGSLVRDIVTNQYSLSVVKTIVTFAKEQNIKTIAEFVENKDIFNILKDIGVDYSQGYYFGKPQDISKII